MISAGTIPARNEKNALAGNSGTPDTGNRYVTESGVSGLGGWSVHSSVLTGNTTLDTVDSVWLCNATGGTFTVTLPTAISNTRTYTIKKIDSSANAVTIDTTSSQTIDGSLTQSLPAQYDTLTVISDGANWYIL